MFQNDCQPVSEATRFADSLIACASALTGAADALRYRAAAEGDDMLDLIAAVIDDQASTLREMSRMPTEQPVE